MCKNTNFSRRGIIDMIFSAHRKIYHVTNLLLLRLIWQNDPDMRDQRESESMEMLARCERTLFKVCLFYTDRQPDNVRDMYQDIVCNLWQAWTSFRHESKENICETASILSVCEYS